MGTKQKRKSIIVTRYLDTNVPLGSGVYLAYRKKMIKYVWNSARPARATWIPIKNDSMEKLMLMLSGDIIVDRILLDNLAAVSTVKSLLKIKERKYVNKRGQ